jgi:hypothetical protein
MILDLLIPFGVAALLGIWELYSLHRHDRRHAADAERARRESAGSAG